MYFLAIALAVFGGILLGACGASIYITFWRDDDEYYEECDFEEWK